MFNFQGVTYKTDFGTSCGRTGFHLRKKPLGNQYLQVLRILVAFEILAHLEISAQFGRHYLFSIECSPDLIHKKDFDIYDPVTIFNFQKKLAQNKYICVGS